MNNNFSTDNHFVQQQIKRCDRSILISNIGLLLIHAAIFTIGARYWYNFIFGPFPMTVAQLQQIQEPSQSLKYFVTVTGDKSFDTGFEQITQKKWSGIIVSSDVSGKVVALEVENKLLLVKAVLSEQQATTFTGELTEVPSKIQTELINDPEIKEVQKLFFPFLLSADDNFRDSGAIYLAVAFTCIGISSWNLIKVGQRQGKLELHPLGKRLATFGNFDVIATQINSQIATGANNFYSGKNLIITTSWLIQKNLYNVDLFNLEEIAWIYTKVTQHSTNGIPTGKTHTVVVIDRSGATLEISTRQEEVKKILTEIMERIPWVIVGYSDDLQNLWQKDRASFLEMIQQRREQISN
jgi:Putative transmembrane protein precursor